MRQSNIKRGSRIAYGHFGNGLSVEDILRIGRRYLERHPRIHRNRELHGLAGAADAVVRVGRGHRELGRLHCGLGVRQGNGRNRCGILDITRKTRDMLRIRAYPVVCHRAVGNRSAEDDLVDRAVAAYRLCRRGGHHHLRVHQNGEIHRSSDTWLASCRIRVGRGDSNMRRIGLILGFIISRKLCYGSVTARIKTDVCIVIRPCVCHVTTVDTCRKGLTGKGFSMTEFAIRDWIHHHLRIHGNIEIDRLAGTADLVGAVCEGRGDRDLSCLRQSGSVGCRERKDSPVAGCNADCVVVCRPLITHRTTLQGRGKGD